MKLRIDPPAARTEGYSGVMRTPDLAKCVLNFVMQPQQFSNWCWAAIAASLVNFYGIGRAKQEEIAASVVGFGRDASGEPIRGGSNVPAMLDEALRASGCYSHWSPGGPTFERIAREIEAGRPLCVSIEWRTGGGHYVVISGHHSESRELHVEDPKHGRSVQRFDDFPNRYQGCGAIWRGVFWTCSPDLAPRTEFSAMATAPAK